MAASDLSDTLKQSIQIAMASPSAGNELINLIGGVSGSVTVAADRTFTGAVTMSGTNTLSGATTISGAATLTGGATISTNNATITDVNVVLSGTTGTQFGTAITQKLAFFGSAPIAQPASANQAAVATTAATTSTPWGFGTSTQANAIVTLVNELRTELVALGLIKGSS